MTTGVRPNGVHVAPLMPTGFYKILSARDLDAIVAYLRTIKPIRNEIVPSVYRAPMHQEVFPGADKPLPASAMKDKVKYGFYLATIGHCMECHSPREKGVSLVRSEMGVGRHDFKGPWGVSTSRNITSDREKGLGGWTDGEVKRAITQGISRNGEKLKPPMGFAAYARMTDKDMSDLIAYLRTVPPRP
jgi:mono/diheme cytochrome c family protein